MPLAETLITIIKLWGLIGLGVAVLFLFFGIDRVDPAAKNAYAFRPLLLPGVVVIWPLVLWRWWQLEKMIKHGCPAHSKADARKIGEKT